MGDRLNGYALAEANFFSLRIVSRRAIWRRISLN
jgi:hypothetical protein